jgi:hypothetical protein
MIFLQGGVVAIHISWICNLDFDFMAYCLPRYVRGYVCPGIQYKGYCLLRYVRVFLEFYNKGYCLSSYIRVAIY